MDSLGKRLKSARENKRLSQVDVFRRTGINNKTLSRYENDGTEPDADSLKRLSELYDVTTDWIIGGEVKYKSKKEELTEMIVKEIVAKYNIDLTDNDKKEKLEQIVKLVMDDRERKK